MICIGCHAIEETRDDLQQCVSTTSCYISIIPLERLLKVKGSTSTGYGKSMRDTDMNLSQHDIVFHNSLFSAGILSTLRN